MSGREANLVTISLDEVFHNGLMAEISQKPGIAQKVWDAMDKVRRGWFVPDGIDVTRVIYTDNPIGFGRLYPGASISQPSLVGRMASLVYEEGHSTRALEIGAGFGYNAAILSHLYKHVDTVDVQPALVEHVKDKMAKLGRDNVDVYESDGAYRLPEYAWVTNDPPQYDAIIVTARAKRVPEELLAHLAIGGRIVIPVGRQLIVGIKLESGEVVLGVAPGDPVWFFPLIGEGQWSMEEFEEAEVKEKQS